jgi:hypothetical protein
MTNEEIKTAVSALSRKLDVEEKEIETGLTAIVKERGCTEREALSRWKSRNRVLFSSKTYRFLVIGTSEPRELTINRLNRDTNEREPTQAMVANVACVVENENGYGVFGISLWDDLAESVSSFEVGKVYSARMRLDPAKGYANLVGRPPKIGVLENTDFPTIEKIGGQLAWEDIDKATTQVGKAGCYKGEVVRTVNGGVEVDSPTSIPVMCWCDNVLTEASPGSEVYVLGRVAENKSGDLVIYANAILGA